MSAVVLDASAVVRLYVPDGPLPEGVLAAVDGAWANEVSLLAPDLMGAEVCQALWKKEKKGLLERSEVDEILDTVQALPIRTYPHGPLLAPALSWARRHGLTVNDALYAALAARMTATLITADVALAAAASSEGIVSGVPMD